MVLVGAACGTGEPTDSATDATQESVVGPQPATGDGLALRIAGSVDGGLLCPGGRRPCLPFDGPVEPATDGTVWVSGRLVDGVLVVDDQQPIPQTSRRDYANRCPDQDLGGPPSGEMLESMYEDPSARPPGFVDLWDSDDGVLHLGVAGDTGPAATFLDDLGIADQVCLVGGFPHPDDVLETVQQAVGETARERGFDGFGVGRDGWEGTVTIDLVAFDAEFRTALDQISAANDGVPIIAVAGVEVVNGDLGDYDAAMASVAVAPDPAKQLTATCGPVVFSSLPPDLDEFPPLDGDAQSAIDELVNGPTGVEADGFDRDYRWSIASRTDQELVLFGQGSGPDGSALVDAQFERRDGAWIPTGWGGCRVEITAPGLGPAAVAIDPDQPLDPEDTELSLLINEQACASGQAPIGREIVPLITETEESVTVVVLVAPVEGGAECPGNPWHPVTVTLESPLGSRQLLDGHRHPPQPVGTVDLSD